MSDISLSTTKKSHYFILYFSYFIIFFPYLLKLLFFLSPLFITTSLLLLALLTLSNTNTHISTELSGSNKVSFWFTWLKRVVERILLLQPKLAEDCNCGVARFDDAHDHFEELEVYKIVFQTPFGENPAEGLEMEANYKDIYLVSSEETQVACHHHSSTSSDENSVLVPGPESNSDHEEELMEERSVKIMGGLMEEFEDLPFEKGEKEVKQQISVKSNKVDEEQQKQQEAQPPPIREGSKAISTYHRVSVLTKVVSSTAVASVGDGDDDAEYYGTPKEVNSPGVMEANSQSPGCTSGNYNVSKVMDINKLGSFGSMRKEKEWRRTLACKLFEERHSNISVDGSTEGMDLLWETYHETDHNNYVLRVKKSKSKTKQGQKKSSSSNDFYDVDHDEEEGEEEEDEEESDGQLCCLQALKFSARKMNLGVGRPNLVKISKALKGIGWLHHVSRHGKKVHH